jgi:GAF domain-containing protein
VGAPEQVECTLAVKAPLPSSTSTPVLLENLRAIREGLNLPDILDRLVNNLARKFPIDTCTIGLFDSEQTGLDFIVVHGLRTPVRIPKASIPTDLWQKVTSTNEPITIADLDTRPDLQSVLVRRDLKSFMILPLWGTRAPLGIVTLGSKGSLAPLEAELPLLTAAADMAAIAIEKASLHNEDEQKTRELETLHQIAPEIAKGSGTDESLNKVLADVLSAATRFLEASGGAIYLEVGKTSFEVAAAANLGSSLKGQFRNGQKGILAKVLRTNEPQVVNHYQRWPERWEKLKEFGVDSVVAAPLISANRTMGVIAIHDTRPDRFTERDKQRLVRLAAHAAVAIENARLIRDAKATETVMRGLLEAPDFRNLLSTTLLNLRDHFGFDGCGVFLKEPGTGDLLLADSLNYTDDLLKKGRIPNGKGIVGWVARYGRYKIVSDTTKERRYIPGISGGRSDVCVPLKVGQEIVGVLAAESRKLDAFSERHAKQLTQLGAVIAIAVKNASLFELSGVRADIGERLREVTGLDETLQTVARAMSRVGTTTFCTVFLTVSYENLLQLHSAILSASDPPLQWNPPVGTLCKALSARRLTRLLTTGEFVHMRRKSGDGRTLDHIAKELQLPETLECALAVPLNGFRGCLGMCILGKIAVRGLGGQMLAAFSQLEIEQARALARHGALHAERAMDQQLTSDHTLVLERMIKVGRLITGTLDLEAVLQPIVEAGRELLNAQVCSLWLAKRDGFIELVANSGSPPGTTELGKELEIRRGRKAGLTGFVAASGMKLNLAGNWHKHPAVRFKPPYTHLPGGECTSVLMLPLRRRTPSGHDVVGVFKIENRMDRHGQIHNGLGFDKWDEWIFGILASFAENAIKMDRLFRRLTALNQIARVGESLQLEDVFSKALDELNSIVPFDTASIQLLDGKDLKIVHCRGFGPDKEEQVRRIRFDTEDRNFPNYEVIRSKRVRRIPDVTKTRYNNFRKNEYCAEHIRSWMGVPLLRGRQVLGMLSIETKSPCRYTREHEDLAFGFARQVATAIANAEIHQSTESLFEVMQCVMPRRAEVDVRQVLQRIAEVSVSKTGPIRADSIVIHRYNAETETFSDKAIYAGPDLKAREKIDPPLRSSSVVWQIWNAEKPYKRDYTKEPPRPGTFAWREGVKAMAGFRLRIGEESLGVMMVNFQTPHRFNDEEMKRIEQFAQLAALVIDDAWQLSRKEIGERMAMNTALSVIPHTAWVHDAAKLLALFRSLALALSLAVDKNAEDARQIVATASGLSTEIARLIPDNRLDVDTREPVELSGVIRLVLDKMRREIKERQLKVDFANLKALPVVLTNRDALCMAVQHVAQNAIHVLQPGGTISFSGRSVGRQVELCVSDNGPGIPQELMQELGDKIITTGNTSHAGWVFIKFFIRICRGSVEVRSTSAGTTVFIRLPAAEQSESKTRRADA